MFQPEMIERAAKALHETEWNADLVPFESDLKAECLKEAYKILTAALGDEYVVEKRADMDDAVRHMLLIERERCAKIAERFFDEPIEPRFEQALDVGRVAAKQIAGAIRAAVG